MSPIEVKKKLLMDQKGGVDVSEVFNTSLWSGNGAARTITTGVDSDEGSLVWIKPRNVTGDHTISDTLRGPNYHLSSNTANPSQPTPLISAFSSSGYSLTSGLLVNGTSYTYVGWQFRSAPKFFDVVQYTGNGVSGRQIAHNLGVKPGMMIVKRLNGSSDWRVYHQARTANAYGALNLTSAFTTSATPWSGTEPTASDFTVGDDTYTNALTDTYIAYLFAHDTSSLGVIQCGSYVGNGSATGPVVNLGWRPQYLMIKEATDTGSWQIIDAQRGFTATNDAILLANTSGAETSSNLANPNSTGFQIASAVSDVNTNAQTYIYMAIREAA